MDVLLNILLLAWQSNPGVGNQFIPIQIEKAFLVVALTTLDVSVVHHKRWSAGLCQISFSRYCTFIWAWGAKIWCLNGILCLCSMGSTFFANSVLSSHWSFYLLAQWNLLVPRGTKILLSQRFSRRCIFFFSLNEL